MMMMLLLLPMARHQLNQMQQQQEWGQQQTLQRQHRPAPGLHPAALTVTGQRPTWGKDESRGAAAWASDKAAGIAVKALKEAAAGTGQLAVGPLCGGCLSRASGYGQAYQQLAAS